MFLRTQWSLFEVKRSIASRVIPILPSPHKIFPHFSKIRVWGITWAIWGVVGPNLNQTQSFWMLLFESQIVNYYYFKIQTIGYSLSTFFCKSVSTFFCKTLYIHFDRKNESALPHFTLQTWYVVFISFKMHHQFVKDLSNNCLRFFKARQCDLNKVFWTFNQIVQKQRKRKKSYLFVNWKKNLNLFYQRNENKKKMIQVSFFSATRIFLAPDIICGKHFRQK